MCLHPSGKIYVACDVLFNEVSFPFSTGFPSNVAASEKIIQDISPTLQSGVNVSDVDFFCPIQAKTSHAAFSTSPKKKKEQNVNNHIKKQKNKKTKKSKEQMTGKK